MRVAKCQVFDCEAQYLIDHLKGRISFGYENKSQDMLVLALEEYYLRNGAEQMNMVIIKEKGTSLFVDIVAAGGDDGLFASSSKKEFINRVLDLLDEFALKLNLIIKDIKDIKD